MRTYCFACILLLFALTSAAQTKEHPSQADGSPLVCTAGRHVVSWRMPCALDDRLERGEENPCKSVNICVPNCPKGYRQVRGSLDALQGHPACMPVETSEPGNSGCLPLHFELVQPRAIPLAWYLRAEISEKCGVALLKAPIEPQYHRVAKELHGEGTAHFLVTVGRRGRVIESSLLDFVYTGAPPVDANKILLSRTVIPSIAVHTLKQLEFEPYLFRQTPFAFQTKVTIVFKLGKEPQ